MHILFDNDISRGEIITDKGLTSLSSAKEEWRHPAVHSTSDGSPCGKRSSMGGSSRYSMTPLWTGKSLRHMVSGCSARVNTE